MCCMHPPPPFWIIIGCGPKENKYAGVECVPCLPIFGLEMIVGMGRSSKKGGNATKHQKKVSLKKHYFLPPPTFCF